MVGAACIPHAAVLGIAFARDWYGTAWPQGFTSAHLFGAVCPERGEGVALVLPEVSVAAMGVFLAELSRAIPAGTHAGLVLDGAGWHVSEDLTVPANLTLIALPPYTARS